MKEELITYDTAVLAKEKGFPNTNEGYGYTSLGKLADPTFSEVVCEAPTQSLLQKWLREEHKINVSVRHITDGYYICEMTFFDSKVKIECLYRLIDTHFKTYEYALEKGLFEALKLIK